MWRNSEPVTKRGETAEGGLLKVDRLKLYKVHGYAEYLSVCMQRAKCRKVGDIFAILPHRLSSANMDHHS